MQIQDIKMKACVISYFVLLFIVIACTDSSKLTLKAVSVADFADFVTATNYITDAERYGWSIVQLNVFDFETMEGATWRLPDSKNPPASDQLPVTQVSFNDAMAYCEWSGTRLPSYAEYWQYAADDKRPVVYDNQQPISPVAAVNLVGNVWEITTTRQADGQIRLAGGSLFCSESTCLGTQADRVLYVDVETGNLHIGFAVIK